VEFVAIDFETTAYETDGAVEPWQLGVAVVRDDKIVETHEFLFSTSVTAAEGTLMEQWDRWQPLLAGRRLVAHNTATERTVLTRAAPLTKWGPWVDTMKLAKARYPKLPSYKLGDLCEMFGLIPQIEGRTWHDGLYDAVACANLANFLAI
jgi:DNA polymerase-3 subunit epsilon